MPDGRIEVLIGLDDRETRARHLTLMTKSTEEASRQRRFPNTERPRHCDHVPSSRGTSKQSSQSLGRSFIRKIHLLPRGMVRVTVVPFPFFDSSST